MCATFTEDLELFHQLALPLVPESGCINARERPSAFRIYAERNRHPKKSGSLRIMNHKGSS
jgi:hypothetical protein